ncbi:MAG: hypothetical protein AAF567_09255 [Actinomycetota bacterium]
MATRGVAEHGELDNIRRVAASGLVAVGVLAALFSGVFRYIDDHFHSPETFFVDTESLADNADVRERLFNGFRAEIIAIANGEAVDGVDPLAGPSSSADEPEDEGDADPADPAAEDDAEATDEATDEAAAIDVPVTDERIERDQAIESILLDVFDSDLYNTMFDAQLARVQTDLVRSAALPDEALLRDAGDVIFDARLLYPPIYEQLAADPRTAEITQNPVPDSYGVYPLANRETTINAVWWLIENGPNWRGLTFALSILCLIGAAVIAERRPSRIIEYGLGMVGLALVVVVSVYILRAIIPLLTDGPGGSGSVVAVYAANLAPLISAMWRTMIIGVVLAVVGAIAKLIWPDDWVYGHVSDDRGVRSVRRRRGTPESATPQQQQQQVPMAAAVPVAYPPHYPYAQPPGWGAPYPGQPYGAPYGYPAGPYAHPGAMALPGQVVPGQAIPAQAGSPTVPVTIVSPDQIPTGEHPVVPGSNGTGEAQVVPRVSAADAPPAPSAGRGDARATVHGGTDADAAQGADSGPSGNAFGREIASPSRDDDAADDPSAGGDASASNGTEPADSPAPDTQASPPKREASARATTVESTGGDEDDWASDGDW